MSEHGPIMTVFTSEPRSLVPEILAARLNAINDVDWSDAIESLERIEPAAVITEVPAGRVDVFTQLADRIAIQQPYVPLIVLNPTTPLPLHALPLAAVNGDADRLIARLNAALRVRALHDTMLRRIADQPTLARSCPDADPLQDASVLLLGRGGGYSALSVALGEQLGLIGALSMEAAAKHLNARDVDGIVIGEGFSDRVLEGFLCVLSEDPRYRNLPVVAPATRRRKYDLPNLEFATGAPETVIASALPLIWQHALEQRIIRTLRSIDADGLIDARTGLLTPIAFARDFAAAVKQSQARGASLSVARFTFADSEPREQCDAARMVSRLMRRMDLGTLHEDGTITAVFIDAGERNAGAIAKRLASVMKHTVYSARRGTRLDPHVTVETLAAGDTAESLLARLTGLARRAAAS